MISFGYSLLTGAAGQYTIAEIKVCFDNQPAPTYSFGQDWFIHRAADYCLQSRIFNLATLASLHTFTHEMGHALTSRLFRDGQAEIIILTRTSTGCT